MSYTIITPKSVQKQLDSLPNDVYERIVVRIQQLAEDPRPDGVVKMKGANDEYRIRVGDYRLRYEIDDENLIVLLLLCKHRRDVYRKN
jgi:mRNA interferase RelE/StbE